jgi:protein-disulfide isomerase
MRSFSAIFVVLILTLAVAAQKPTDVLATATGHTIKLTDLSPEIHKAVGEMPAAIAKARKDSLEQLTFERVLDLEAAARGTTVANILLAEKAKVADPTEAEIKAIYDANQAALAGKTLDDSRKQIVTYLRGQPEQKALLDLFASLKTKYKVTAGKDVNAADLAATDTVETVNGKAVTARELEEYAKENLFELRANYADALLGEINDKLLNDLISDDAKSQNIDASEYIAREVTNKMKDFSDEERETLLDALEVKLYAKYKANIVFKAPEPAVVNVSVDDDPAKGPVAAPVTVVMFSDFQCSACKATHPLLEKAMAMFPGKIRFVVRDFPLESLHPNGFRAALAANAANAQGKFFEYTEVLYANQDALDDESLKKYAAELGLNVKLFEIDFNSEKNAAEVRKDMADGNKYGVNSTPTIFVNGVKARDLSVNGFKAAIERALKK